MCVCVCVGSRGHAEPMGHGKDSECYSKHDTVLLRAESREVI